MDEVTKDQLVDEVHIPVNREQRLDLFIKLGKWGLNSYLYAPKVIWNLLFMFDRIGQDDSKHRARWRELYTEEECDQLKELVEAAEKQVSFRAAQGGPDF